LAVVAAAGDRPALPELPLEAWEGTKDTLHLWAQIVGKVRLALVPPKNHWWHVPLYVDVRGLTTRRIPGAAGTAFSIEFDFVEHRLVVRTSRGELRSFELRDGLSVAEFDERLHGLLRELGVDVPLREEPFGVPTTTPFPDDRAHASYDADFVHRFWTVLGWTDAVLDEFSGWFCGKQSPVHLFWHSFDLALTRFSGRPAPSLDADPVTEEAYSAEVVSFGFWAGDPRVRQPTFYSYAAPEPNGLRSAPLNPQAAEWSHSDGGSLALLAYDAVRSAPDPRGTLLAFLQSAYDAGAGAAGWDRESLRSQWCPSPERLAALLS
jgi:Family of unknown function (DUF5996)